MSIFYQIKKYLQYRMRAGNEHSIHSPFVFTLYTEVISGKNKFYSYDDLNKIRVQLLGSDQIIEVKDLGAGSKKMNSSRKVSDIAKYLLKKYKEHSVKAKLERNYYNKSTKLAEQQRKLVDKHFTLLY